MFYIENCKPKIIYFYFFLPIHSCPHYFTNSDEFRVPIPLIIYILYIYNSIMGTKCKEIEEDEMVEENKIKNIFGFLSFKLSAIILIFSLHWWLFLHFFLFISLQFIY